MRSLSKSCAVVAAALVAGALSGCSHPTYGRFVETGGPVYGKPVDERSADLGGAYGAGPRAGTGIYRMVPIPEAPRAPVEVP